MKTIQYASILNMPETIAPKECGCRRCRNGKWRPMTPKDLYTRRTRRYIRLMSFLRAPSALRTFFRQSGLVSSCSKTNHRILDAGCGTGMETLALRDAIVNEGDGQGRKPKTTFHAFDLTPSMLEVFQQKLDAENISSQEVSLCCADVCKLDYELPASWRDYDLVVTAFMLEYLPREKVVEALKTLRSLLKEQGCILIFIAKRNCLTRPWFGWWWDAELYTHKEVEELVRQSGFSQYAFRQLPRAYRHLSILTHIVEATK